MAPPAQHGLSRLPAWGKLLVGGGVVVVTSVVYWFVFYSDAAAKIEGAQRQKTALGKTLVEEQRAQARYFADRDELALREQRARELGKLLPSESDEDAFLSTVQSASNAAGIDLEGYSPQEEVTQSFYAKVPMKLEMKGKFLQIAKFAYELAKVDRIINVENIQLVEPQTVGDDVILKGRCLATAFHALKPKETGRRGAAASGGGEATSAGGKP